MGAFTSVSSVTGTHEETRHSIGGTSTGDISGHFVETLDLTTTYTVAHTPHQSRTCRALIVNIGDEEIRVRVRVDSGSPGLWNYYCIPAGRNMEIRENGTGGAATTTIYEIAVRSFTGVGRAIVHQIWR